jgi:hypothetical protein
MPPRARGQALFYCSAGRRKVFSSFIKSFRPNVKWRFVVFYWETNHQFFDYGRLGLQKQAKYGIFFTNYWLSFAFYSNFLD